jgi:hypothetical protein
MPDDSAKLTFRIKHSGGAVRLFVDAGKSAGGKPRTGCFALDAGALKDARRYHKEQLEQFKSYVGAQLDFIGNEAVVSDARKRERLKLATDQLRTLNLNLIRILLNGNPDQSKALFDLFKTGLGTSRVMRGEPPFVEVRSRARETFPWELVMTRYDPALTVVNRETLMEFCGAFMGFGTVVRRSILDKRRKEMERSQDSELNNDGGLPMKLFQYAGLRGVQRERAFFQRQSKAVVDLEAPWPKRAVSPDEACKTCARVIYDPRLSFVGRQRKVPDQVQHFACHCDATDLDFEISLAADEGSVVHIPLAAMRLELTEIVVIHPKQRSFSLPMIFMNACESSVLEAEIASSFPDFFLQQGNRAFIGTETAIPDDVSAKFSQYFYSALWGGATVGLALNAAKWELLENHGNPLGLLYTLYGDPDLRVKNIVSKEALKL